jgi:hypothetical protein
MSDQKPNVVTLSGLVSQLLEKGYHPSQVRRALQAKGVPWRYRFSTVKDGRRTAIQGERERVRRLKSVGLKPCKADPRSPNCDKVISFSLDSDSCLACLSERFRP